MAMHITEHRPGFAEGLTWVTQTDDAADNTGIALGVLKLAAGQHYHYRFTKEQGYGHAELGDNVLKVKQFDTVKTLNLDEHAQCAAPGYGLYYSWVIRHLDGDKYSVPDFTEEHRWVMEPEASCWMPGQEQ